MSNYLVLTILLYLSTPKCQAQVYDCVHFLDANDSSEIPFVYISFGGKVYNSNATGVFCGLSAEMDTIKVEAFWYVGKSFSHQLEDSIFLEPRFYQLNEVQISVAEKRVKYLKDHRPRKVFQRGAGETIFRRLYSDKPIVVDSLKLYIQAVHHSNNYIRVVLSDKEKKILSKSEPLSVPLFIENSFFTIPTGFWRSVQDTFYVGIEFLEESIAPDSFQIRKYQIRREGILSPQNNGLSLGGFKLKGSRKEQSFNTYFARGRQYQNEGALNWTCYIGVYFSGEGQLEAR